MATLCRACGGSVCPTCGGCIEQGECSCFLDEIDVLKRELAEAQAITRALLDEIDVLKRELTEAHAITCALLGAPPPRIWKKWPNIYKRATDFLKTSNPQAGR